MDKMKSTHKKNHILSQKIIRFLAIFLVMLIVYSSGQVFVERLLIKKMQKQDKIMKRQTAKRKLGRLIREKIILLELYSGQMLSAQNKFALKSMFNQAMGEITSIMQLLPILKDGGTYTDRIIVNLNTADEVSETIVYTPVETGLNSSSGKIVVELINILPKIEELKQILININTLQIQLLENSFSENTGASPEAGNNIVGLKEKLHLYSLQAQTLMLRCRENSNKIFVDTTMELRRLGALHEKLMNQFDSIRQYAYIGFQIIIIGMFAFIFIKIVQVLRVARASDEKNKNLLFRLKNANDTLEEIFNNLPVGIVLISSGKKVIQINTEGERILGYQPGQGKELYGKICHNNFCTIAEDRCPIYDLNKPKVVLQERNAIKSDGSVVSILKSVIPIKLKGEDVLLEAFMDLSAIKDAEQAIIAAKNAAESASKAKSEFLANMSHEIRTPMNAIIGFTELLLASEKDPSRHNRLKMIMDSAHALLKLINEILDLSKIEAGKVELKNQSFSLNKLVNQVTSMFFISAREKGLDIDTSFEQDVPEFVVGDEMRLRQVLFNLMGNAVKFTREGSIRVHASYAAPDVVIQIEDTGIGISEDRLNTIFDKFEQADNSIERNYGGSGLGLSISLSLVRLMGGRIAVESQQGKGTTFTIRVPLDVAPTPSLPKDQGTAIQREKAAIKPVKQVRCLVVEDNPVNTILAVAHLNSLGVENDTAENGKIALDMMSATSYDFILMDMHMPVMDGIDTLAAMKRNGLLKKTPVVALTADAIKDNEKKYLAAGCSAYISKPFSHETLQTVIYDLVPHLFVLTRCREDSSVSKPSEDIPSRTESCRFTQEDVALIREGLDVLKKNNSIFNPDELENLSLILETGTQAKQIRKLALRIRTAAEEFDDSALEGILSEFQRMSEQCISPEQDSRI